MSLILLAVLIMTYLLKFAAMRYYLAKSRQFVAYRGDNMAASIGSE
jgi:hypothetical protein